MTETPQPLIGEPNESGKKCWGCDATTPYNLGFCSRCWTEIPEAVRTVYICNVISPEPYASAVRGAVVDGLHQARIPARVSSRTSTPKLKVDLASLGLIKKESHDE